MKKRNPFAGRAGKIIYWIATIWLALGMLSTGIMQLLRIKEETAFIIELGYPGYFLTILGVSKILGVAVLLMPRLPLLKEWTYAGFFFTMIGAVYSHIAAGNPVNDTLPPLLLLVLTIVSWFFRPANRRLVLITNNRMS